MPNYKIARNYEKAREIETQDLLTAVMNTCNYEADLYDGNRLVMSCLGFSRYENTRRLLEYGITSYVNQNSQCWSYRYTDPSMNAGNFFVNTYHYPWGEENKIDITIKEYRETEKDHKFMSLGDVMKFVRDTISSSPYKYNVDEDIYVKLFGEDGLIYFAADDWQTEGEPEMYILVKDGHKPEYGARYYLQKRFEKLQPKFGGYKIIPAAAKTRGVFEAGDVVTLETDAPDLIKGRLYLITDTDTTGEYPEYTIRDLDDYKVSAKVKADQITIPSLSKQIQMV